MKRIYLRPFALLASTGLALASLTAQAADKRRNSAAVPPTAAPAAAPGNGFDAFQLVVERNIFNPNRVGRTRATAEEKPARVDEISLVGTMNYDRGLVAFFDSPDAAYKKAVREGESVADFKVERIAADRVELTRGDKPVTLKIAQQLRRVEGADWTVAATPVARTEGRPEGGSSEVRPADPAAVPEIPADASEVLKRLLKKREKQFKQ